MNDTHAPVSFNPPALPRPAWGPLGEIVYKRTYSRWLEAEQRRERWNETVDRVVRFSLSLDPTMGPAEQQAEGDALYRAIHGLEGFVSGRTLWMGGSEFSYSEASSIANFNCFAADTSFLTRQGYVRFSDLADGQTVQVLTQHGAWRDATVRTFGTQPLQKITLKRLHTEKVVYATANHRWKVRSGTSALQERTTAELRPGDAIPTVRRNQSSPLKPCAIGIQHGIVYGDGTLNADRGTTLVALQGDKRELAAHFTSGVTLQQGSKGGIQRDSTTITALPWNWKDLPPLSANGEYLLGFLMGWFATDGSNSGTANLTNKDPQVLEWARSALALVGIYTSDVQLMREISPFDGTEKPLYRLNIHREGVGRDFFLRSAHAANADALPFKGRDIQWKVVSVEATDRVEPVWCVQEPETETFVLENGLLTRNCSSHSIQSADDLHDLVYLLMSGTGGGPRLTRDVVETFNRSHPIRGRTTLVTYEPYAYAGAGGPEHTRLEGDTLIAGDSRAGWAEIVSEFVAHLLAGRPRLHLDFSHIRPKGTRLKSFGGYASGPEPLIEGLKQIEKILAEARRRKRVTDLDLMDICCLIGRLVVAGGTRRSALMILGDTPEFAASKTGAWYVTHPWRSQANISVLHDTQPSREALDAIFDQLLEYGEPGFFNAAAASVRRPRFNGTNPCQPASALLLTPAGLRRLGDLGVGDVIWSETGWTTIRDKWSTGVKSVYRYQTTAGQFIGTENHRIVQNGQKVEVGDAQSIDLLKGPALTRRAASPEAVMTGLLIGDGYAHMTSAHPVLLCIGENDQDYFASEIGGLIGAQFNGTAWSVPGFEALVAEEGVALRARVFDREVPETYLTGSLENAAAFLRGLYSANGSVVRKRVTLKSTSRHLIEQVQVMLSALGIASYFTKNSPKMVKWQNGEYESRESYDLNITRASDVKLFMEHIGFIQTYKNEKLAEAMKDAHGKAPRKASFEIIEREDLGDMEVFDITVDNGPHTYWTGGLNVSNCGEILMANYGVCNLCELNLISFVTGKTFDLHRASAVIRLLARHALRITNLRIQGMRGNWDQVQREDRLLGVGLTGVGDLIDATGVGEKQLGEWFAALRYAAQIEAKRYADHMGVPHPLLTTTIKPSGSLSLLPGVSSGLHAPYAPTFIRRIRISAVDAVAQTLAFMGVPVEDDAFNPGTQVFSFPVASKATRKSSELSAVEQLERYKAVMRHYVDHNCFSGDTKLLTRQGLRSFESLEPGAHVEVLAGDGRWSQARVVKYQGEKLYRITLRHTADKDGRRQVIHATGDHRWALTTPQRLYRGSPHIVKTTSDLVAGDTIAYTPYAEQVTPLIEGIQNGIVHGDGSVHRGYGKAQVYLCGPKRELKTYFHPGIERDDCDQTRIYNLDPTLKAIPDASVSDGHLLGFLMGLIATDGSVSKRGAVVISSSKCELMEFLTEQLPRLGIRCRFNPIPRKGSGFDTDSLCYTLHLAQSTLRPEWFIRGDQRERFSAGKIIKTVRVESVEEVDGVHDVWCVEEPRTNQFTLEGGLLTFNCSVTVTLAPEEKGAVVDWMEANWDSFVGVSFLKKDDNSYPQMPFEAIEQGEYDRLKAGMPDLTNFGAYLEGMEASNTAAELEADCVGGACPVR